MHIEVSPPLRLTPGRTCEVGGPYRTDEGLIVGPFEYHGSLLFTVSGGPFTRCHLKRLLHLSLKIHYKPNFNTKNFVIV